MISKLDLKAENNNLRKKVEELEQKLNTQKKATLDYSLISQILDNANIGVIIHNLKEILYANNSVLNTFRGLESNALIGRNPMEFIPDNLKEVIKERFELIKKGKPIYPIEETIILPNSKTIDVIISGVPIIYNNQSAVLLTLTDISEQKEISTQNQFMLDVLENAPISIIITDKNTIIEYVNKFFTEITGYSKEEVSIWKQLWK